jgi:MFS family permease
MSALQHWTRGTFASLGVRAYRTYWSGLLFTFVALWFTSVARGFLAFDLTQSSAALGGVFIAFGLPQLALTLIGGVLADRLPRKRVVLSGVVFFAVENAAIGALAASGLIEYWMLVVSSMAEGAVVGVYIPARTALVGDLVAGRGLGNAVALQQVSFNTARVGGPAVAGALIATPTIGPGGTYLLAAGLFGVAAAIMTRLPAPPSRTGGRGTSALRELAGGLAYVRGRPALLVLVVTSYVVSLTAFPYIAFTPAVVDEVFDRGAVALGVMTSAIAVGALAAAIGVASIVDGARGWVVHLAASFGFGLTLAAFAVAPSFELALLVGLLLGATEVGFLALNQGLSMRFSEPEYYGRVQALLLLGFGLFGVAALPLGFLADAIGVRTTLFAQGAACAVLVAGLALFARLTRAEADAVTAEPREVSVPSG